jgi:hypothetical protein
MQRFGSFAGIGGTYLTITVPAIVAIFETRIFEQILAKCWENQKVKNYQED